MLLIQVLLIQVSTIIIFDNLYVQNQSTTTAQALARTKTRMTTWLNSNFRGRWKEVSGPNVTLASNQWMIVMRIGKQGGNYDYHYWYQRCANRKQIETICVNFLRGMEATKLSVTGHMYFVPRTFMERVDIFEDFITLLSGLNKKQTPLVVNSFYIIDDAKQRDKMTEEFYLAVKKEIAAYQEKCDYLIKSSSQSPAVMERWVLKVQALEEKKRHYEGVLQRELDGLDDEFSVLKLLSQELQVRANSIRSQRFQQKAA